jgi:hypothetical protein
VSAEPHDAVAERRRIIWEIWILLGLSLGRSAVYAIVDIIQRVTAPVPLAQQSAALNVSQSDRSYVDLTYQLLGITFALVPVLLAVYLLANRANRPPVSQAIGLDWHLRRVLPRGFAVFGPGLPTIPPPGRRRKDLGWGVALAAAIGVPGLAFYALGRLLGITVSVQASGLGHEWWAVPVLVLSAFDNGALEEIIVVAYLSERMGDLRLLRVSSQAAVDPPQAAARPGSPQPIPWRFFAYSALLRGSYHLYQGFGPFIGNVIMGVVFAWWYRSKWGRNRVLPLVIAHTLLDVVSFVGYALIPESVRHSLGIT